MSILSIRNVSKTFGNHKALDSVSIEVPEGCIYGLLGPNGAGKTTLIRIINQILAPDSGEVFLESRKLKAEDVINIGYLPEERGLYRKMKVGEQCIYLAQLKGISHSEAVKRLKYWFEKFEIQSWWNKKVEELSKGMQQKVQFITTIIHNPKLLIFDEPFSGFDPINANMLKNEILDLKAKGATVIFSTHNMNSVEELCDYITLINKSKCILEGQLDAIRMHYKSGIYEIQFVGSKEEFIKDMIPGVELIDIKEAHAINTATLKMESNDNENRVLKSFISKVHILSFKDVLPGMNEVFIKLVEGK